MHTASLLRILVCLSVAGGLAACATTEAQDAQTSAAGDKFGTQASQAIGSPLSDLNLLRMEIPAALMQALRNPYASPADERCDSLVLEVRALDAALDPDLDAPATARPGLAERGVGAIGDATTNALRGVTEGILPFRGWVRRLSGADRYSREVMSAVASGMVRRAYLKGLGQARGCTPPAAPAVAP